MLHRAAGIGKADRCWLIAGILAAAFGIGRADGATLPPVQRLTADDGDDFYLYVADQETYDSNLYRLSAGDAAVGPNTSRSDFINTASLGGEGQWLLSRQIFDLGFDFDENRFAHNDALNNTSIDGRLYWNWVVGSSLSGQAAAEYSRGLASFAETLYLGKDIVATTNFFGNARYQVGPHWALLGDFRDSKYSHDALVAQYNNFTTKSGSAGIEYATNIDDTFELQYQYNDGSFPQDYEVDGAFLNRNYHENSTRAVIGYGITDKTSVNGYAGYLKRDYLDSSIGHFSGDIWRVALHWRPTDKTELIASGWHELHAFFDNASDYFVSKGGSLSPVWIVSDKLSLAIILSLEKDDYVQSSTSVLLFGSRNDSASSEQLNLRYTFRTNLIFNLFLRNEHRNSNQAGLDYADQVVNLNVAYRFW